MIIIVYSKNGCSRCEQAKKWLAERYIPFQVKNVDDSTFGNTFKKELLMMDDLPEGWGFPIILWDGQTITGFDEKILEEMQGGK